MMAHEDIKMLGRMNHWRVRIVDAVEASQYRGYIDPVSIAGARELHTYGHARFLASVLVWLGELSVEDATPPDGSVLPMARRP